MLCLLHSSLTSFHPPTSHTHTHTHTEPCMWLTTSELWLKCLTKLNPLWSDPWAQHSTTPLKYIHLISYIHSTAPNSFTYMQCALIGHQCCHRFSSLPCSLHKGQTSLIIRRKYRVGVFTKPLQLLTSSFSIAVAVEQLIFNIVTAVYAFILNIFQL